MVEGDSYIGSMRNRVKKIGKDSIEEVLKNSKDKTFSYDKVKDMMEELVNTYQQKLAIFVKSLSIAEEINRASKWEKK